jgi:Spx/MgsR family transcriptional regulator
LSSPRPRRATLSGIPNCDTVRQARAWLDGRGVDFAFHDLRREGVPPDRLQAWIDALGWERLLNRQGTTWRRLDDAPRASVVDRAAAAALVSTHPTVIRRPVIDWPDGRVTVGFDPGAWPGGAAAAG